MRRIALLLAVLSAACSAIAQGGPPLLTDDPGTVEKGKWEINVAWINRSLRGHTENEIPHFDANRGISDNAHFKIEVPWLFVTEDGKTISGDGGGSIGVKWRFIEGKGKSPAISTYPQLGFSLAPRSVRLGLSEGGTSILLPMQVQWDFPGFSVNADAGVIFQVGEPPAWLGGVAIGRKLSWGEVLAEIHGEGVFATSEQSWVGQLGLRHDMGERATLLFSFGRTIGATNTERLRWISYLGIQFHY